MPEERLTMVETAALFILMTEARTVTNATLTGQHGCRLEKHSREKLEGLKLIEVERPSRNRILLTLGKRGWAYCTAELESTAVPPRAGAAGGALYAVLRRLGQFLTVQRLDLEGFIEASAGHVGPAEPTVEERIRTAYRTLAHRPGDWVSIADLRDIVTDVTAAEMDAALRRLNRRSGVALVPEANQKTLDTRTRAAAVIIGDQPKHSISMGTS
ncbi:hypothetical protein Drose_30870 [Dactylosporangium roseum]|uniref:MarR family transcriptional regulator n=1 Tax=Dactylosporangium roseum TaxID=47989 RepID=A0ABY5Z343_9ACTN|nr:hypothetical protein [Dactylosporangium roseum]UWZ35490.1 hypothetical protein Drose_30870 [Dactylosporangium roseum]